MIKPDLPITIFSLTPEGQKLAQRLKSALPHCCLKHQPESFIETAQTTFSSGHPCIFICATGIVIRALAPVLKDKYQDPAVIVLDQQGRFVVPLLSGHEGGAAKLANEIANAIGAEYVSTTATDYSRPVYAIGMGCDRGCPLSFLQELYDRAMENIGNDALICAIASIELKSDEQGLITLAKTQSLAFQTYSKSELEKFENMLSEKSEIVYREVSVYGVAEAAALCAASKQTGNFSELVMTKHKNTRATIAVARSYVS